MRKDDSAFAGAFHAGNDVEQEGVITVLFRWHAVVETTVRVGVHVYAGCPSLHRERRVRNDVVKGFELAGLVVCEHWGRERVVVLDLSAAGVMEPHVHAGKCGRGVIHLLAIDRKVKTSCVFCSVVGFQQERPRAAGGVVDRLGLALGFVDADDCGHGA